MAAFNQRLINRTILPVLAFLAVVVAPARAAASAIAAVAVYGNFETAGVDLRIENMNFNESATLEYRRAGETAYRRGHDFVRYDGNHLAGSLFGLTPGVTYELRLTLADPDGVAGTNPALASVTTRPEYTLPSPLRVVAVAGQTQLDDAVAVAVPGDEIRLAPGTYPAGIFIYGRSGSAAHPIVFTSQGTARPVIGGSADGGISLEGSNYYVFNDLEVHNEIGNGIVFRGCHDTVIRNCYIHDSQPGDYTANIMIQHSEEADPPYSGNHLILGNVISDDTHDAMDEDQGPGATNVNVPGQSYFGILLAYQPGGFVTIRNNIVHGTVDGIHPCGDEGGDPVLGPDDPDLLATWHDQNLDLYDNVIYDCKDDGIELDGHMVNGRVFRNRIGKCENAVSLAPFYPGPLFVARNFLHGFHQGCFKQNTGVDGITRNALLYHNTIREKPRSSPPHCGDEHCLYRGEPALQRDFVYLNNIFQALGRVYNGDMYTPGNYHSNDRFDYDLMHTIYQTSSPYAYKWVCEDGAPLNNTRYVDLPGFRAAVGQESHGLWGDPVLKTGVLPGFDAASKLLDLRLLAGSPAIDAAVPIAGINDAYHGAGPDMGAFERGAGGDVNGEGRVDAVDLAVVAQTLAGHVPEWRPPCTWPGEADYNLSGALEVADGMALARWLAGN